MTDYAGAEAMNRLRQRAAAARAAAEFMAPIVFAAIRRHMVACHPGREVASWRQTPQGDREDLIACLDYLVRQGPSRVTPQALYSFSAQLPGAGWQTIGDRLETRTDFRPAWIDLDRAHRQHFALLVHVVRALTIE